ncbi:phospholipase A and acyltransferase 3-like isoform X2 [Crotalus tigris]|uniref:phospholipase A and acyltransferase 3-like isoform X2 n=1 Tax=Crotalus tigris TaxID=88082 RepID=UPI00192F1E95|nr:phospholipase A and acyltransferase 3-like isoform X2 [Crotalus tigris]
MKDVLSCGFCQQQPLQLQVDLKPGDLIEIFRTGYQHWAVYVGLGMVVHLTSADKCAEARAEAGSMKSLWAKKAMVKREPLSDVVGKNKYRVSNKHDATYDVRTPDQIVSMAEKLEGQILDYELTTQNCEHFANNLRYDVARSDQIRYVLWLPMAKHLALLLLKI